MSIFSKLRYSGIIIVIIIIHLGNLLALCEFQININIHFFMQYFKSDYEDWTRFQVRAV